MTALHVRYCEFARGSMFCSWLIRCTVGRSEKRPTKPELFPAHHLIYGVFFRYLLFYNETVLSYALQFAVSILQLFHSDLNQCFSNRVLRDLGVPQNIVRDSARSRGINT